MFHENKNVKACKHLCGINVIMLILHCGFTTSHLKYCQNYNNKTELVKLKPRKCIEEIQKHNVISHVIPSPLSTNVIEKYTGLTQDKVPCKKMCVQVIFFMRVIFVKLSVPLLGSVLRYAQVYMCTSV